MPSLYSWIKPESLLIKHLRDANLRGYIINSSAYHKGVVRQLAARSSRDELVKLYQDCRRYATNSIVNGLMPLRALEGDQLDCSDLAHPFRILARVCTSSDLEDVAANAKRRSYQSFSILENLNLSHFPGEVLYGYYTGVTAEMIGYIFPMDANTDPYAKDRLSMTLTPEILLDLDDLVAKARKHRSYCQVSVFTRQKLPNQQIVPLYPDCVIAIDEIDSAAQAAATAQNLPILTIRRAPETLYRVHDDCLEAANWTEWVLPLDPNAPHYDNYDDYDLSGPKVLPPF